MTCRHSAIGRIALVAFEVERQIAHWLVVRAEIEEVVRVKIILVGMIVLHHSFLSGSGAPWFSSWAAVAIVTMARSIVAAGRVAFTARWTVFRHTFRPSFRSTSGLASSPAATAAPARSPFSAIVALGTGVFAAGVARDRWIR